MRISARNILKGKVKKGPPGQWNEEVIVELRRTEIDSIITKSSGGNLGLAPGKEVTPTSRRPT